MNQSTSKTNWWLLAARALLVISVVKVVLFMVNIIRSYTTLDNPLIPKQLSEYMAFPYYFLIGIWALLFLVMWKFYKTRNDYKSWVRPMAVIVLALSYFEVHIIHFINGFYPSG